MRKLIFDDCICQVRISNHSKIKDSILSEIENADIDTSEKSPYLTDRSTGTTQYDSFSKLDWSMGEDFERPWVKLFLPSYSEALIEIMKNLGYTGYITHAMWFQQYLEGGTHGWHIHSNHFTGVYYLEYPEGCGRTRVCSPYNLKGHEVDAVEGDMIVFPSHWIHKAMPNSKDRKTIISYNFDANADHVNTYILEKAGNPIT